MPGNISFDADSIDAEGALTLCVGWKSGAKTKLAQLTVGAEVEAALRALVDSTLAEITSKEGEPWAPDADLSQETYLYTDLDNLGDAPVLAAEHGEQRLADVLLAAEALSALDPNNLPAPDLSFYAITVGDTPGTRAAFLRRTNPRRGLRSGRLLTSYHDVLTRITDPVFAFDSQIDLVLVRNSACVLSQTAFAALFRAQDALLAQVPSWTTELVEHVGIAEAGQGRLNAKAQRDSRARARLEAIVKRGHLADVSPATIRDRMRMHGLSPEDLLDPDGNLLLAEEDIHPVLQFLNEDLFLGALTDVGFRADKKAAR